ncbi:MAG: AraC family transcriptional regulator ligand-binding domain-containing protein [Alcanivorax sp.]|jgi:AraC-like DNA-binding protein|nr:MAG: AraC family transcriptional regulator [Oceanobacter sp.]
MSDQSKPEPIATDKSSLEQPKAVAMFLRPLASLLRQQGIEPGALFREHGLSLDDTNNPESQVNVTDTSNLLSAAEDLLQDPSLGINMARQSEYSVFGGLGLALSAGGSLLSVLQRMTRFQRLISNAVRAELVIGDDKVSIHFHPNAGHTPHPQGMQYVMANLVRLVRIRLDSTLNPLQVLVAHENAAYCARMARYFRVEPEQADHYAIVFARDAANSQLHSSDSQLAAMLDATLNERLAAQEKGSLVIQLSLWLEGQLPEGEPSLADAGAQFHMSVRSLQRRLNEEELTWKQLVERTRRTLVERHLKVPGTTVTQLAFLLGFSDVSSFSRAFKKWYGVSPSQFRANAE